MKNSILLLTKHLQILIIFLLLLYQHQEAGSQFANGADIGWLSQMESQGYIFINDSGVQKSCMEILQEHGINSLRFRVWVNPGSGWCNKKDVATMAHRADTMGFRVMINFHYSDSWADPGKQYKPAAWEDDTLEQLLAHVYSHTYEVLDTIKSLGVIPEWVQVGNETNNGMLWPDGRASDHMKNFAAMVNSGYDAIKAIDSAILVIVQLSNGHDNGMYRWMFDGLKNNGAKWDVIGMSVYPYWANLPWATDNNLSLANMQDMIARYQTKVMVCETGYNYNQTTTANHFLLDLIEKTKSVDGLGVFYWEPESYGKGYQLGAWDPVTKKPTTALDAFLGIEDTTATRVKNISSEGIHIYPNPLTGNQNLYITLNEISGSTSIKILNVSGQQLFETMVLNQKNIEISNLEMTPGIYFVQITSINQKLMQSLIVN